MESLLSELIRLWTIQTTRQALLALSKAFHGFTQWPSLDAHIQPLLMDLARRINDELEEASDTLGDGQDVAEKAAPWLLRLEAFVTFLPYPQVDSMLKSVSAIEKSLHAGQDKCELVCFGCG
jgi:hypothetical protein